MSDTMKALRFIPYAPEEDDSQFYNYCIEGSWDGKTWVQLLSHGESNHETAQLMVDLYNAHMRQGEVDEGCG